MRSSSFEQHAAAQASVPVAPPAVRSRKRRRGSGSGGNKSGAAAFAKGRSPTPGVRVESPRTTSKARRHSLGIDEELRAFDEPDTMRGTVWREAPPPGHDSTEVLDGVTFRGAIPKLYDSNAEERLQYAKLAWRTLTARKLAKGKLVASAGYGKPIADDIHWLLTERSRDEGVGKSTTASHRRYLARFERYAYEGVGREDKTAITAWHQVTADVIDGFVTAVKERPKHGVEGADVCKPSSTNKVLDPLRILLRRAGECEYLPNPWPRYERELLRAKLPDAPIVCLSRAALVELFAACLRVDALPERAGKVSALVVVVFVLLTGMRRREYTGIRVSDVNFRNKLDGKRQPYVQVRAELAKNGQRTGKGRRVMCLPYSPLLVELLHALCDGRDEDALLLDMTYEDADELFELIREHGKGLLRELRRQDLPDDFSSKTLRSTCATYLTVIEGVPDSRLKADRMGHSIAVQDAHYRAKDTLECTTAPSLEVAFTRVPDEDDPLEAGEVLAIDSIRHAVELARRVGRTA